LYVCVNCNWLLQRVQTASWWLCKACCACHRSAQLLQRAGITCLGVVPEGPASAGCRRLHLWTPSAGVSDALHFFSCIENLACQVHVYKSNSWGTQLHAGFRQNLSASPHGKAALAGMPLRVQQQRQVIPAFHLPTSASSASWQLSQLAAASHPYITVSHPMPCTQAVAAVTAPAAAAAAAAMAMASPEAARAPTGGMPAASGRSSTHCH